MIRWTDSCRFDALHGAIVLALVRAEAIYAAVAQRDCWITSGNDSEHMIGSKHYIGQAVDLRVHHVADEPTRARIAAELRRALGPQFTVLYESPGTPNAHIHVQFDGT